MAKKTITTTEVEIFGTVYPVRAEQDPEYLRELADVVDSKMREIASKLSTPDPTKVAVLAALNLTDEWIQCRNRQEGERNGIRERVETLAGRLEEALQD